MLYVPYIKPTLSSVCFCGCYHSHILSYFHDCNHCNAGARYCSLIGDFNGWSPTENSAKEGHFGRDDYGYWLIIVEDKLRDGEQPDEYFFQEYNYVDDYDKGDRGIPVDEIMKRMDDEYWEPGEDRSRYIKLNLLLTTYPKP